VADDTNKVIISRIQNRRGLKQDLPQPLRPGEIGFAMDTRQVYIGSDPNDAISGAYNKKSVFENTLNARATTLSIANNNLISFTVPFKKYAKGEFDGVVKSVGWLPTSPSQTGSIISVFPANAVISANATVANSTVGTTVDLTNLDSNIHVGDIAGSVGVFATVVSIDSIANSVTLSQNVSVTAGNVITFVPNNVINVLTNNVFTANDITVTKNGTVLVGNNTPIVPITTNDYSFFANASAANTHVLNFRSAPLGNEDVAICYYSNTAVIRALEGNPNPGANSSLIAPYSSALNFYTAYNIPKYRQIPNELVTVSRTTGTGLIGLQFKHVAVTADSGTISNFSNLSLGNLYVSRSDEEITATIYSNTTTLTFGVPSGHNFEVGANISHIYVTDPAAGYLNEKLFAITDANSSMANVQAALPYNNFVTAIPATAVLLGGSSFGTNATIQISGDLEGVISNMHVLILDETPNSNINGQVYVVGSVVQGVSGNPGTMLINTGADEFNANISSNLSFVNYGTDSTGATMVQIRSAKHGFSNTHSVLISNSSNTGQLADDAYTVNNVTVNTFFIEPTAAVLQHITGNISPNLAAIINTTTVTPVRSINLRDTTTLVEVTSRVNSVEDWPQFNIVPDQTNLAYFSHKPAFSSVALGFRLHEDPVTDTLKKLSLIEKKYTSDDTVKAKLEAWLNTCLQAHDVNIFNSVGVAELYNTNSNSTVSLGTYLLNIDITNDELVFNSREEARDFNKTVNRIYFERPNLGNDEIKGLVNIKTNIELQTKQDAAIGSQTTSFANMNTAVIPAAGGTISGLTQSVLTYDSYKIDYSVTEAASVTAADEHYHRVGTMFVAGRRDFTSTSNVILQDVFSELLDSGLTGNITFTAQLSNTDIVFNVTNTLSRDLNMKYVVQRWASK
jgi:hypothetical protein